MILTLYADDTEKSLLQLRSIGPDKIELLIRREEEHFTGDFITVHSESIVIDRDKLKKAVELL